MPPLDKSQGHLGFVKIAGRWWEYLLRGDNAWRLPADNPIDEATGQRMIWPKDGSLPCAGQYIGPVSHYCIQRELRSQGVNV